MTFPLQYTATALAAGAGLLLWIVEGAMPFFRDRTSRGRHAVLNLGLAATNLLIILPIDLVTVLILGNMKPVIPSLSSLVPGGLTRTLAILLLLDLWMYLWHRLNHETPLLWRFHSVHHSDPQLDVTSAWRFHPGEIALSGVLRLPVLLLIGAGPEELVLYNLLMTPVIEFHHSNVRLPEATDRLLRTLLPTPLMHRIHHSILRNEHDSNYGALLSVWDRLFGTLHLAGVEPSKPLGLNGESGFERQRLGALLSKPFSH
ncbi:MAG: sterol desaturase family protein [Chlorobiaceae bacterium]|nr:sterol desaturase family protein [Chlorobiaceae bacterium]